MTTPSQTIGPFFAHALPYTEGPYAVPADHPGAIEVRGTVLDGAGEPVPDALLEICQPGVFGRCATDKDGGYAFGTVKPGSVPGSDARHRQMQRHGGASPDGSTQAPHINVGVFARGMLKRLFTRIYFAGHPAVSAGARLPAARACGPIDGVGGGPLRVLRSVARA